ncbi:hypothetical protein JCM10213_002725 [Rhodosporidiobolus nylandii]
MGKVRHRKRTRDARVSAAVAPLVGADPSTSTSNGADLTTAGAQAKDKKGSKREQEITGLLDNLRSQESRDRVFAASTLSSLLLTLPPLQQRLLLSKNLIGLLIERLTLPVPSSSSSAPPPPPSDDLTTAIESLGALRNLAVSSPPHILSEMHNKRLLLPLVSVHLPLLAAYLPSQLAPAPAPVKPALPAGPAERKAAELANEAQETLRAGYWDWAENVLVLLWSLAESNTKILASLNGSAGAIVALCMAFLEEERLGLEKKADGMDIEGGKKKKKDAKGKKGARVPMFVAVAAAQTLHAFLSSNYPAHTHLLASSGSGFSPSLSSLLSILDAPSFPSTASSPAGTQNEEEWQQLRVLSFGVLLEIAKGRSKRRDVEQVREHLREEGSQRVLLGLVEAASGKLDEVADEGRKVAGEIDPTALPTPHPAADSPAFKLASLERRTQTLQLALEILSEWLASGVPNSSSLAGGDAVDGDEDDGAMEEEDEEWGGISMDVEDVAMDSDDEDAEAAAMGADEDGIIRKTLPGDGEDAMLDDLAATAGADSDSEDEDAAPQAVKLLGGSLPLQLLSLTQSTPLSFLPATAFASPLAPDRAESLLPTSATDAALLPSALVPLADALTTVSVRALEALNNLYVTLSRAKARRSVSNELQTVFDSVMALTHNAIDDAARYEPPVPAAIAKKGKNAGGSGTAAQQEGEMDDVQERRLEVVMACAGVIWGCVRLGLELEGREQLVIGPDTTPFLLTAVYPCAFAAAPTPSGEAIRVRVLGALGCIGRRKGVPAEENRDIGHSLLTLLPSPPSQPANPAAASTPEILLQAIDSLIDVYADEEREYDVPVFRETLMLEALDARVPGVRAAIKKIDRNKFPDLRSRADGALENLVAFVGYRKEVVKPRRR